MVHKHTCLCDTSSCSQNTQSTLFGEILAFYIHNTHELPPLLLLMTQCLIAACCTETTEFPILKTPPQILMHKRQITSYLKEAVYLVIHVYSLDLYICNKSCNNITLKRLEAALLADLSIVGKASTHLV